MPLFDRILVVDWSGAAKPVTGKNSIWACLVDCGEAGAVELWLENFPTRATFMARFAQVVDAALADGKRLLAGFDFAFGYPQGTAERLTGSADWQSLWRKIAAEVEDAADNANNRFALAGHWNSTYFADGARFWGRPQGLDIEGLPATRPLVPVEKPLTMRTSERYAKGAKSVWQLAYAGSVGSQSLLGIARLSRFLDSHAERDRIAVWPFETGYDDILERSVVLAEIYPSLFSLPRDGADVKDAAQVRRVAESFAGFNAAGRFGTLFGRPAGLSDEEIAMTVHEEGWILGIGHADLDVAVDELPQQELPDVAEDAPVAVGLSYVRDPAEIYRQSFETIRREADLDRFPAVMQPLVVRLIHACGMVDLAEDIVFSEGAFEAGAAALAVGAPVLCDAEMVRHGIIKRLLPAENETVCLLNDVRVRPLAAWSRTTRSAAQVNLWTGQLEGAVVAIGNAPTALYHLLELIDQGAPKPALILGFPVGFVGAAESKAELIANNRGIPFIAVKGRRGGSAMASAAVNALAGGLGGND
ncbi:precorrin-8X/cobalt-precorrin-8 methylmutase [Rhizobium taibaishanense]|uniref:Precorrin-8X/cobalt-precorrin-8 methylmutase n=1 Tax=Allorhizobium taibaishanense TaxID=887144 RepID=A0A7W6HIT4_9HYPH|nr:precorrin-8X/cobalt-precorrin-8 methylmutase [Allorhizobium taibaishanense]